MTASGAYPWPANRGVATVEADRWIVVADRFGEQAVLGLAETWQEAIRIHLRHAWANRDPHRHIRILPNPAAVARALE